MTQLKKSDLEAFISAGEKANLGTLKASLILHIKTGLAAARELLRIREEAESGVHSCHPECQKPTCVLQRERDYLASAALAALSGAGIPTPEKGYVKEPYMLLPDIGCLAHERDNLKAECERLKKLVEIADVLITNDEARKDWDHVKQLRVM